MSEEQHEERARRMGWSPKEEFKGDPDKWRTAEQFLEVGDNLMPVLKERMKALEDKYADQTALLEKSNAGIRKLAAHHKDTREHALKQARREVKEEMRKAAASGDLEKYDLLAKHDEGLVDDIPPTPVTTPEFNEWVKDNAWYNEDPVLAGYADSVGSHIAARVADDTEFYSEIRRMVERAYPTHSAFKKEEASVGGDLPPATPVASVEGVGLGGGKQPAGDKGWKDLPQDCRDTYEREFSDISKDFTREQYAKDYFAQFEEEV